LPGMKLWSSLRLSTAGEDAESAAGPVLAWDSDASRTAPNGSPAPRGLLLTDGEGGNGELPQPGMHGVFVM